MGGRYAMGCFYASIPIIGGYQVMQWAISKSHESIGEKGEKLKQKTLQGIGNKAIINGEEVKVGAGGCLGGVRLAVSDESVREKNNRMLKAFLKKEAKKRKKQLRKSEECQDGNSIES